MYVQRAWTRQNIIIGQQSWTTKAQIDKRYQVKTNQIAKQSISKKKAVFSESNLPISPALHKSITTLADNAPNRLEAPDLVQRRNDTRLVGVGPHAAHFTSLALGLAVSPRDIDAEILLPFASEEAQFRHAGAAPVFAARGLGFDVYSLDGVFDVIGVDRGVEEEAAILGF